MHYTAPLQEALRKKQDALSKFLSRYSPFRFIRCPEVQELSLYPEMLAGCYLGTHVFVYVHVHLCCVCWCVSSQNQIKSLKKSHVS